MATIGQYAIVDIKLLCQRVAGHGLGMVLVPGRDRPVGRDQQPLAVVRAGESIAFRDRALSVHDPPDQDAEDAIYFRNAAAACIYVRRYFLGGVPEDFSVNPRLGFLSGAESLLHNASEVVDPNKSAGLIRQASVWRFDALVAAFFLVLVLLIVLGSAGHWWQLIRGTKPAMLRESEFVPTGRVEPAIGS